MSSDDPNKTTSPDHDKEALLALLAIQNGFATRKEIDVCWQVWTRDRTRAFEAILRDQLGLSPEAVELLNDLVRHHRTRHAGNAQDAIRALEEASQTEPAPGTTRGDSTSGESTTAYDNSLVTYNVPGATTQRDPDGTAAYDPAEITAFDLPKTPDSALLETTAPGPQRVSEGARFDDESPDIVTAVSHFRIERLSASGGLGVVYLARQLELNRLVALKESRATYHRFSNAHAQFLLESEITAGLEHPNIVPTYTLGERQDGRPFYVMRLVHGETLQAAIDRFHSSLKNQPVREPDFSSLAFRQLLLRFLGVCQGIAYAHSRGIVHRDLKPSNIMLGAYGETIVVDWGLARPVGIATAPRAQQHPTASTTNDGVLGSTQEDPLEPSPQALEAVRLREGVIEGTVAYMSPEQATGERELGPTSDVYGLGSILFELLTGEAPFTGATFEAILVKRFTQEAPRCSSRRADTPPACDAAVARALARDPAERFASAREFADALGPDQTVTTGSRPAAPDDRSIAVLPFSNLSADPDNEFFSDGLTEELITDLASVKALRVISRASSQQLKGTSKGMREIGSTLGVRYVLTGGARKAGNALRITAQLTDTTTNQQVWAEKYSGTMDDIFDVQERVSRAIVEALRVTLSTSESERLAHRPIKDPRAFELYLRAQALVRRYGSSVDQVDGLIDLAIAIEGPSLPLRALRGLLWVSQMRAGVSTDEGHLSKAEAEARELIRLAPGSVYGYSLLGFVSYERGRMAETVRYLGQALERDPSDADALFFLGIALTAAGQIEAGLAAGRRFLEIDPLSPMAGVLYNSSHWFAGRPAEGLREHEHGLVLDPENPIIHWSLGYTYALLGQVDKARQRADWMRARVPRMPYTVQLLSLVEALEGRQAAARETLATIAALNFDGHITFHLSESYAMAGDVPAGLQLLEQCIERGFYPHEYIATSCPFLAPLRSHPEFARIAARAAERKAEFVAGIAASSSDGARHSRA